MKSAVYLNYISTVTSAVCGFCFFLIVGASFGPSNLGVFNQVFAIYIICSQVAALGIHLSVLKHVAECAEDVTMRQTVFTSGLVAALPIALGAGVFIWAVQGIVGELLSPDVGYGMRWAALGVCFFSFNKILLFELNALSRFKEYAVYQACRYVFMLMALGLLIALDAPGKNAPATLATSECILFIFMLISLRRELNLPGLPGLRLWIRRHISFGARACGGHILLDMNTRVDVLFLGYFATDRVVGLYSMAAILAESAYQLPLVMRTIFNPRVIRMLYEKRIADLQRLVRKSRWTLSGVMLLVGGIGAILFPWLLPIITGRPEYAGITAYFAVIMLGIVIASGYVPFGLLLVNAGRPGTQTIMTAALVLFNIIANAVLVPVLGAFGAAVSTGLIHVLSVVLLKMCTQYFLRFQI